MKTKYLKLVFNFCFSVFFCSIVYGQSLLTTSESYLMYSSGEDMLLRDTSDKLSPALDDPNPIPDCMMPENVKAEVADGNSIHVSWTTFVAKSEWIRFELSYRQQNSKKWKVVKNIIKGQHALINLEVGQVYETKVRRICLSRTGEELVSEWALANTIRLDNPEVVNRNPIELPPYECGDPYIAGVPANTNPLNEAFPGDVFTIGKFPILLEQVSGAGEVGYNGVGLVPLPFGEGFVKVQFSHVFVNTEYEIFDGTVYGIYDLEENWPELPADTIMIGGAICLSPPVDYGFDENGIHSATGQAYDEYGFDAIGSYIAQPPYPGYQDGDPYDPEFDPQGFNHMGIHTVTGTPFDENGCDRNGLDVDGQPCENENPCPYYWISTEHCDSNGPPTTEGTTFGEQVQDSIRPLIIAALNTLLNQYTDSVNLTRTTCDGFRLQIDGLLDPSQLGYTRSSVLGNEDEYYNESLHKKFEGAPANMLINIDRDPKTVELEENHVKLYQCDKQLKAFIEFRKLILVELEAVALDTSEAQLLRLVQRFTNDEVTRYSDPAELSNWVFSQMNDRITLAFKLAFGDTYGYHILKPSSLRNHRRTNDYRARPILPSYQGPLYGNIASLPNSDLNIEANKVYREDLLFQLRQGFPTINGIDRAYFLEAFAKQRKQALGTAANPALMPIEISKLVAGRNYRIYLDEMVFTTTGASMNAYIILDIPTSGDRIVFRAENIGFGIAGTTTDSRLYLDSPVSLRVNNAVKMSLLPGGDTYVAWDCSGFTGIGIDAEVEICRNYLVPVDPVTLEELPEPERVNGYFKAIMPAWGEFLADISIDPFYVNGIEGVKWEVQDAVFDFSNIENPGGINFPPGYDSPLLDASSGRMNEIWKGFYLNSLTAHIDIDKFGGTANQSGGGTVTIGASNVIIDNMGFTGGVFASPILNLSEGNLNGWAFSIDTMQINVVANRLAGSRFSGLINVPLFSRPGGVNENISPEDCMGYQAIIQPGNHYLFAVRPRQSYEVSMWKASATLDSTCSVNIQYINDEFHTEAILNGYVAVNGDFGAASLEVPEVYFEGLVVSNQSPYIIRAGKWDLPNTIGADLGGFSLSLHNMETRTTSTPGETALSFFSQLKLGDEDTGLSAECGVDVFGEIITQGGRQKWKYKNFKINDIYLNGSFQGVKRVEGVLSFYEDDPVFGKGFRGMVGATFEGFGAGGLSLDCVAQFGKMEGYKYFMIDALAFFEEGIDMGGLKLKGFGGGAYKHMTRNADNQSGLPESSGGGLQIPSLGESLSGIQYTPNASSKLGLKATIVVTATNEEAFNANATFEVEFNESNSLSDIWIYGNARFFSEVNMTYSPHFAPGDLPPNNGANVSASLDMHYNFPGKTLDADMAVYMNVANVIKGIGAHDRLGWAKLHFSPDEWYINIGTPDSRNGMKVEVPGLGNLLTVSSYLDIGTGIPDMPPLDQNVQELTEIGSIMTNSALRSSGDGFAFGAKLNIGNYKEHQFLIFYASLGMEVGFDVQLSDWGDATCSNTGTGLGINGWYASGQAWAYVQGSVGLKAKIFGTTRRFEILEIAAAATLQTRLPRPFWARGAVGGRYRILGGLIKGQVNFEFTVGEKCEMVGGNNPILELEAIQQLTPFDEGVPLSTQTIPTAIFNLPVGVPFKAADLDEDNGDSEYLIELVEAYAVDGNGIKNYGNIEMDNEGVNMRFIPFDMLPENDTITFFVKVDMKKNGVHEQYEEKSIQFVTRKGLTVIPPANVEAGYPMNGQFNFYRKEYRGHGEYSEGKGYMILKAGQPDLFYDVPEGYIQRVRISQPNGVVLERPLKYDAMERRIEFPLPASALANNQIYQLSIVNLPDPASVGQPLAVSGGLDQRRQEGELSLKILYQTYFRTSQYDTFKEKINAFVAGQSPKSKTNFMFQVKSSMTEPFGQYELGSDGEEAMIQLRSTLNDTWFNTNGHQLIYTHLPTSVVIGPPIDVDDRTGDVYGIPPAKAVFIKRLDASPVASIDQEDYLAGSWNGGGNTEQIISHEVGNILLQDFREIRIDIERFVGDYMAENPPSGPFYIIDTFRPWMATVQNMGMTLPPQPAGSYGVSASYVLPGIDFTTTYTTIQLTRN